MLCVLAGAVQSFAADLSPTLAVTRMNNNLPIIDLSSFSALGIADEGDNINGPCCVRVPDWVAEADRADPSARYYLYFSHHHGDYIRMAWAADIEGPWTLFNCGSNADARVEGSGVLDLGDDDEIEFTSENGIRVYNHIASPDVIVDHTNQQFIMYFHGKTEGTPDGDNYFDTGGQKTAAATSPYGLNFNLPSATNGVSGGVGGGYAGHGLKNAVLGNAYFRVFEYEGGLYAFSNYGPIWKAPEGAAAPWAAADNTLDVWEEGPLEDNPVYADLAANYTLHPGEAPRYYAGATEAFGGSNAPRTGGPRHFAVLMQDDGKTLEVWYTSRGEMPERIFRTTLDLSQGDWTTWDTVACSTNAVHQEMLRPEYDWEGADQPLAISANGSESDVNQLRDPYLFKDADGQVYLFYSGEGEEGLGMAAVHLADSDGDGMCDDDEAVAGTDPQDAASVFKMTAGSGSLRWASVTGRTYWIDYSTNLLSGWQPLLEAAAATPPTNRYAVSMTNAAGLFFKARVGQD